MAHYGAYIVKYTEFVQQAAIANAAAMVSTIKNGEDYQRLKNIAAESGLSVSGWISKEAAKQADSLWKELEKR